MSYRRAVLTTSAALLCITAALPAEAQTQGRAGAWQGVYIGGHVGGAIGSARQTDTSGYVAGAHIGVNGQFDRVVVGVEADASATSNGSRGFGAKFRQGTSGSMRARVGYSFDRVLVYGTGGIAVSNYEYRSPVGSANTMRPGAVVGAGAELLLTENVAVRGEVLHYNFSRSSFSSAGGPARVTPTNNVLRGGLSYKF